MVKPTISSRHLRSELDGLVRIAASIHGGWCSAVLALDRYGSASRGDPIYQAGQALGQLVRTLYLCDYFLNPYFRTLILKVLNYGESIHTLQRAIHAGPIGAKRGRRPEELRAITGSLSLLTNIVLAWNTHRMEGVVAKGEWNDTETTDASVLSHIPPVHYDHINLGGIFLFLLRKYRGTLVERGKDQSRIGAARSRKP